ncbi:MAG: carbohydrate ABC transporter permease [Oscillospiraceae bacterium]|nr:carbohydrate ABC transporter permease [Oscillospiraceae bacterium]
MNNTLFIQKKHSVSENRVSGLTNLLLNMFFIACAVLCIYPILLVVGISFTDNDALRQYGYKIIPSVFSTDGYAYAFSAAGSILRSYGITIFNTVAGTVIHVLVCALFAYPMARPEFKSRKFFMGFLLIPMLFNGGMVPWYVICTQVLGLRNTIWAMILPMVISPWNVIVLKTFINRNIPDSLIESARLEGCSEFRVFWNIVLPLSKAGLATIAFFSALAYWNDYWHSLMLITDESLYSLQYLLYNIMAKTQFLSSLAARTAGIQSVGVIPAETARMAMCVLSIGPIVIVYPYFQRFFVKGIMVGSIKG